MLVSCLRSSLSFSGRGLPAGGVAPPSHTPGMLGRRAWPAGRRAPENSPRNFGDRTLAATDHHVNCASCMKILAKSTSRMHVCRVAGIVQLAGYLRLVGT